MSSCQKHLSSENEMFKMWFLTFLEFLQQRTTQNLPQHQSFFCQIQKCGESLSVSLMFGNIW